MLNNSSLCSIVYHFQKLKSSILYRFIFYHNEYKICSKLSFEPLTLVFKLKVRVISIGSKDMNFDKSEMGRTFIGLGLAHRDLAGHFF